MKEIEIIRPGRVRQQRFAFDGIVEAPGPFGQFAKDLAVANDRKAQRGRLFRQGGRLHGGVQQGVDRRFRHLRARKLTHCAPTVNGIHDRQGAAAWRESRTRLAIIGR